MIAAEAAIVTFTVLRLSALGGALQLVTHEMPDGEVGNFDEHTRVLSVSMTRPDWSAVLAHELAHVEQALRGERSRSQAWELWNAWLRGRSQSPKALLHATREIQRHELAAERFAVRCIRRFSLPVDGVEYTREANAYVWKHELARRTGQWPLVNVSALCPTRLIALREIGRVPKHVESAALS